MNKWPLFGMWLKIPDIKVEQQGILQQTAGYTPSTAVANTSTPETLQLFVKVMEKTFPPCPMAWKMDS